MRTEASPEQRLCSCARRLATLRGATRHTEPVRLLTTGA